DVGAESTECDGTPDPQAAVPDLQRSNRVAPLPEVPVPIRGDVVHAAADQTERDGPQCRVEHDPGATPAGDPARLSPPDGDDDAEDDPQGVRAQRERPELPHPLGRAGDHEPAPGRRTPSASSAVSRLRESSPSVAAVMS